MDIAKLRVKIFWLTSREGTHLDANRGPCMPCWAQHGGHSLHKHTAIQPGSTLALKRWHKPKGRETAIKVSE